MSSRDPTDYLQDIWDAIVDIENFVNNMNYEQFVTDRKTLNAVVRSIEIIGEASKRLPDVIKRKYGKLPWKEITGMRDKLIHAYFGIDTEIIWEAVKENLPALKKSIRQMLYEEEKRQNPKGNPRKNE